MSMRSSALDFSQGSTQKAQTEAKKSTKSPCFLVLFVIFIVPFVVWSAFVGRGLALSASHRPHPQTGSEGAVQQVAVVDVPEIGAVLALQGGTRPIVVGLHARKR